MDLKRIGAALLLTGLALVAVAGPASAHTSLEGSNPKEGESVAAAPAEIQLTFGEAVTVGADPIQVTGPDGAKWTVGTVKLADAVVSAPVQPNGPAGAYTVSYKVISDDGDPVTGAVHFTLTAAASAPSSGSASNSAPPVTSPSPSTVASGSSGGGGFPLWGWIIVVVAVVVLIVLLALYSRRPVDSDDD